MHAHKNFKYIGLTNTKDPFIINFVIKQLRKLGINLLVDVKDVEISDIQFVIYDPEYRNFPFVSYKKVSKLSILRNPADIDLQSRLLKEGTSCFIIFPTTAEIIAKSIKNLVSLLNYTTDASKLADTKTIYQELPFIAKQGLSIVQDLTKPSVYYVRFKDRVCKLTKAERNIIQFLLKTKSIVSASQLIKVAWPLDAYKDRNNLAWLMRRVRAKLKEINTTLEIKNLYGYGYYIINKEESTGNLNDTKTMMSK